MDTVKKLALSRDLDDGELSALISSDRFDGELREQADAVRRNVYGDAVFIRGLVEFTNYCKTTAITAASDAATKTRSASV